MLSVTLAVTGQLGPPIVSVGLRQPYARTAVHVPEAAMNEDYRLSAWKYEVWFTRQVLAVKPEAEAAAVNQPTDEKLGFGVRAPYCAHVRASARRRDLVHRLPHLTLP